MNMAMAVALFGLAAVGLGVSLLLKHCKRKQRCTAQTAGIVKDIQQGFKGYEMEIVYSVEGAEIVSRSTSDQRPRFGVGQRVTVFCDPSDPKRHYVLGDVKTFLIAGLICLLLGAAFVAAGLIRHLGISGSYQLSTFEILLVFPFIGLFLAGSGVFMLSKRKKLKQDCSAQVEGAVSDIQQRLSGGKSKKITYHPEFTYTAAGVKCVALSSTGSSSRASFSVGQRVTVFYDPSNPMRHYVQGYEPSAWPALSMIILGALMGILPPAAALLG